FDANITGTLAMFSANDIGTPTNPLAFTAGHLVTVSGGDQYLATTQTRVDFVLGDEMFLLGGSFNVDNQMIARSQVTVGPFATLGGDGVVTAPRILVNGTINPGFGGTSTGILTLRGNVTVERTATMVFDINFPYVAPGNDYDQLAVEGTLTLNSPT